MKPGAKFTMNREEFEFVADSPRSIFLMGPTYDLMLPKWWMDLDIVFDYANFSEGETFTRAAELAAGFLVDFEITTLEGFGGWPAVRFTGPKIELQRLLRTYDGGRLDWDVEDISFGSCE
jgi:hypothetical protein